MPTKILADFTGYGSAMAAFYGGYLVVMLLATLALLQFARSCHILLKRRLTPLDGKSASIWPTVAWGVIGLLIVMGPSFVYDYGVSAKFCAS